MAHRMLVGSGLGHRLRIEDVSPANPAVVARVHSASYLRALRDGSLGGRELAKLGLPACEALYIRSALEVEGTRRAAWAALDEGVAANLAGGTHHAFPDRGEGFCVLNDVAIAIRDLQVKHPGIRILVVDTDAHQGNGTHAIFADDPAVFTYSIHVGANYPSRKVPGSMDVELARHADGSAYLRALSESLPSAVQQSRPDLAIWISGADPHRNDRFGQLALNAGELLRRDRMVAALFVESAQIPMVVLYGGGYNRDREATARIHRNTVLEVLRIVDGSAVH